MTVCTPAGLALALAMAAAAACRPQESDRPAPSQATPSPAADAAPAGAPAEDPARGGADATPPPGLDPYPGATRFCDGRVYPAGTSAHISWESWGTPDDFDTVVDHYKAALGTAELERTTNDATWRFPADRPTRTLSVEPPTASAPWSVDCNIPEDARSIVTITHFPR